MLCYAMLCYAMPCYAYAYAYAMLLAVPGHYWPLLAITRLWSGHGRPLSGHHLVIIRPLSGHYSRRRDLFVPHGAAQIKYSIGLPLTLASSVEVFGSVGLRVLCGSFSKPSWGLPGAFGAFLGPPSRPQQGPKSTPGRWINSGRFDLPPGGALVALLGPSWSHLRAFLKPS